MVIAGYAGVGKSQFAERYPTESIDLVSMPYRWILPKTDREKESSKAAPYLLGSPAYPNNYIAAILEAEAKFKYVLIPSIGFLLNRLYEYYGISYLLCYPSIELKEEYHSRYVSRGTYNMEKNKKRT